MPSHSITMPSVSSLLDEMADIFEPKEPKLPAPRRALTPTAKPKGVVTRDGYEPHEVERPSRALVSSARKITKLVDAHQSLELRGRQSKAFMPNWAVCAAFPYRDPGDVDTWQRESKQSCIILQSGKYHDNETKELRDLGIPFGVYPRYILIWLATVVQAGVSRNAFIEKPLTDKELRCIQLSAPHSGIPLKDFLFKGKTLSYGDRGTMGKVIRQLRRLSGVKLSVSNGTSSSLSSSQMLLFDSSAIDVFQRASGSDVWDARLELSEQFYESIVHSSIPLDWDIIHALGKSAQTIDIYIWLSHQCFVNSIYKQRTTFFSWDDLSANFGGNTASIHKFIEAFKRCFHSVTLLWPELADGCKFSPKGLTIEPGIKLTVQRVPALK